MKIPKKLKILGRTIKVIWDKDLANKDDAYGLAIYRYDEIRIQPNIKGRPRSEDGIAITFLHEILHYVAYLIEEDKLRNNDQLVGRISEVLYQVLKDNKLYFGKKNGKKK